MTSILSLSVAIPTSSKPIFSIFVLIPTADKIISASKTSSPFFVFTVALIPLPDVSTEVTLELVITLIPDFLNERSNCFETSISSRGTILGKNSTTVTSVPIAL